MKMKRMAMIAVMMLVMAAMPAHAKKRGTIRVPGGTNISGVGLVIDASYDPRLDTLCPGYKVVNVVLINQSFNIFGMNPDKDRWSLQLTGSSKPIKAIHDLRSQDPQAWSMLPEAARARIAYPLVLPIGAHEVIDLFVPAAEDLTQFTELNIDLKSLPTKLEILVRQ